MNASAALVTPSYDAVLRDADTLSKRQLDALPYGMIQLDHEGTVLQYNATEAAMSRLDARRVVGKNFFDRVAPCTKVRDFHGRFLEGVASRSLFETFGFVFKFDHGWRSVVITLMYSERTGTVWVLVSQTDGALSGH